MKATKEQVKKLLEGYKNTLDSLDEIQELYARIYLSATSATADNSSAFASGVIPGDKVGNAVCEMADIRTQAEKKIKQLKKKKRDVEKVISFIPDDKAKDVLTMMYIDQRDMNYISLKLKLTRSAISYRREKGINWIVDHVDFAA